MEYRSHRARAHAQEGGAGRYLEVDLPGGGRGQLAAPHLSDHPAAAEALWEVMSPGVKLGPLLVLERMDVRFPHSKASPVCRYSEASPVCLRMGAVHAPALAAMGHVHTMDKDTIDQDTMDKEFWHDKRCARCCAKVHRHPSHRMICLTRM